MDKKLSKLLTELYDLDPILKAHDSLLRSVLSEILASKPESKMDPAFYRDLREILLSRLSKKESEVRPSFFFSRFKYAFAGLALVMGVAVLANGIFPQNSGQIVRVDPESFGSLSSQSVGQDKGGFGGGGALMDYLPEERINYQFHYTGEALETVESVEVLKRVDASENAVSVKLDFDVLNVNGLGEMKAAYTNLEPVDGDGYSLNYDPQSQSISLSEFHESSPEFPWGMASNWDTTTIDVEDVPSEESLIAVSEAFFEELNIDRSLVSDPYVYPYYIGPDSEVDFMLTVVYPFEINGQAVYHSWGDRSGMTVSIDVHRMQVIGVNWIYASNAFNSSSYPAVSAEEVIAVAEQGGTNLSVWDDPTRVVDLDLGTPTLIYAEVQNFTEYGTYTNLYAPAYLFPILNDTEDLYYGDNLVVPLAEELAKVAPPMILY